MRLRLPVLLLALAACGPGGQDTEAGTDSSDTGSVSMSSSPSDPSTPTLPTTLDPTTATTVPPDPTTATTVPPDPTTTGPDPTTIQPTTATTTTDPTFTTDPSSFTVSSVPPPDTSFSDSSVSDTEVFIVPVDVASPGECSTFEEDCPPGSKCMPFASGNSGTWNSTKCVPVMQDPAGPGEPCFVEESGVSGVDNCDFHAMCFFVDQATLQGRCVAMCSGSPQVPVCPPESQCIIANDGVLTVCLPTCDPLDIASCNPGEVCVFSTDAFLCVSDISQDDGDFPDGCEFLNECDPGFACIAPSLVPQCGQDESGCCSPYCDLGQPNLCPPGLACAPWFDQGQAPPGLEDVGVCADP
jgi:hypothetical protein